MTKKIICKQNQKMLNILPVYKLTNFAQGADVYKPYTTALISLLPTGLNIVMRAYEVNADPTSTLCCILKNGEHEQSISYSFGDESTTSGEDLQGIYWGFDYTINLEQSSKLCGDDVLECGFFKWGSSPKHSASLSYNYRGNSNNKHDGLERFYIM